MVAAVMHAAQLFLLLGGKLRLLSPQFSFGTSNRHSLSSTHADQIGFKLGEGGQDIEKHLAHRVGWVVDAGAKGKLNATSNQRIRNITSIRD